ncbi:sugar phosphate permease [Gluconacetobacter johannae DSM 13595]|uniref:MFS transporter n=1 Tax=Gluconacetobacter johannae TaxID=112140 RepID=A0A7W4P3N7_9PROT|nr:MFS transporter [Gluconacetobacter johannae]MBB2176202.1 MFS transporter [Gluconacetobacter johannae]GBQ89181.1 sugar phosphate permease [Gluconacetobacter johannae DSM 13595]
MAVSSNRPLLLLVLMFAIGIVAYADRQIIALLKPELDQEFGWTAADYALISSWSQIAIAISLLVSGWLVDWWGVRVTLGVGVAGWSLATALHATLRTVQGFLGLRVVLGVFEGIGTPATMKMVTAFPRAQRGRVIGILNASPNLAAMATPIVVSLLFPAFGWRGTIAIVGLVGVFLAALWLYAVPTHLADFGDAPLEARDHVPGTLPVWRRVTGLALCKFLTDPVWWFLLFWLPDILHRRFGLGPEQLGVPLAVAYAMAAVGSVLGGWLPGRLATEFPRRGHEYARRVVMGFAALCVLPLPLLLVTSALPVAVALAGLALAAHQMFAANLFGFVTELVPTSRVGRATGIGAFCSNIGGALALRLAGHFAAPGSSLMPMLGYCAVAYALAWVVLAVLAPVRGVTAERS